MLDKYNKVIDSLNIQATDKWGKDCHYFQAVEEAAELIVAIQHKYRSNRKESDREVATEIVDVYMMLRAITKQIPDNILEEAIEEQLERYQSKLNEH